MEKGKGRGVFGGRGLSLDDISMLDASHSSLQLVARPASHWLCPGGGSPPFPFRERVAGIEEEEEEEAVGKFTSEANWL